MEKRTTPKTRKAPKAAPKTRAKKPPKVETLMPTPDPLAGVTIRAEVLTYKPDLHRPRVHITTPTARYYKLVPGVRTTTKAEALASAHAYRERILASGEVPPQAPRPDRFGWDEEAAEGMTLKPRQNIIYIGGE